MDFNLTQCYNCENGKIYHNFDSYYGAFIPCPLCKNYGDGKGKLKSEYSFVPIEITYKDFDGQIITKIFKPPVSSKPPQKNKYNCWYCEDEGTELICSLCKNYEDEKGKLKSEYNFVPIEITYKDFDGQIITKTSKPPKKNKYNCWYCEDKGTEFICSPAGVEFPYMPCRNCKPEEFEEFKNTPLMKYKIVKMNEFYQSKGWGNFEL